MDMMQRKRIFCLVLLVLLLFPCVFALSAESAQEEYMRRYQNGLHFYKLSLFQEAAMEFRRAQEISLNINDWSRALYWVILSQMAFSDFGSAVIDIDELERTAPNSTYTRDMLFHRARAYFIHGYFEEAILMFNRFISSAEDTDPAAQNRRAAAFFWIGESLFVMEQFDEAQRFFSLVTNYPNSPRFEAASFRVELIRQKQIQTELLSLLQLSREESLRANEEHQRTIRTYEDTLYMYQRRIAELLIGN